METKINIVHGFAQEMNDIPSHSVDLIVTSPPYPMIEMWDEIFTQQDIRIGKQLKAGHGREAFELMHLLLDAAWLECDRVLKVGGIACINIGDATRTIKGDFQLYSNHSRILNSFFDRGFAALPDILWRKQTNAPNKFMGSGMLPVGAYVTYEHEYILVLRKGLRRQFTTPVEKKRRRESAFFWEERNLWFSDIWQDIKGAKQVLGDAAARERSAAFPFDLAYRLICMFSVKEDTVLDPFAGTGTTLIAALATGRNGIGIDYDSSLTTVALRSLAKVQNFANSYSEERLTRHVEYITQLIAEKGPMKYVNKHYGFPVMTSQERELLICDILEVAQENDNLLKIIYDDAPQANLVKRWKSEAFTEYLKSCAKGKKKKQPWTTPSSLSSNQKQFDF